jgi:hypothetical protein
MSARRCVGVVALACALGTGLAVPVPAGAAADAPVAISVSRAHVATRLGDELRFTSTVTNTGPAALAGLVAHLNVVSWDRDVYVDPEDWSSERTRYLPPLAPGRSRAIDWTVKAVNSGHFAIYVAVLDAARPATGPALDVRVAEHRSLDAGGALPVALGVPALVGLALLVLRLRRAR